MPLGYYCPNCGFMDYDEDVFRFLFKERWEKEGRL
jgi:hypothetical protein